LGAAPMANHKEYHKGENGGCPQIWIMGEVLLKRLKAFVFALAS